VTPICAGGIAAETTRQFFRRLSTLGVIENDSSVVEPCLKIVRRGFDNDGGLEGLEARLALVVLYN
jgi:hypothetical protein